jgi:hypothetical protein
MEDALALKIELASVAVNEALRNGIMETPDMDDADDAIPPRRSASLLRWLDDGRRSGKRVLTKTIISAGQRTMNGCTSTVSRGEVMALAGSKMGLEYVFVCLNLAIMLSM